ncbi:hypothetical protein PG993_011431 [Apiospora rasikravindrae]|uniref:3beta-hydroxysteroid 3-dehydrogenase n=1 Tax=Apiospora rasikravindrae TaxID=990691 RepID=A0ABR1SE77_9PEZI
MSVVVTGANGGLGSAIVKELADPKYSSCHAIYTVRDATRVPELTSDPALEVVSLDLTDLDNVRQVAKAINARVFSGEIPPIQALILNAGFQDFGKQSWTSQGLDTTFAANYLGHWLLTLLLLQSMNKAAGRIVYMGSQAHESPKRAYWCLHGPEVQDLRPGRGQLPRHRGGKVEPGDRRRGLPRGYRRYGASKLFLVMMQHELQARLDADRDLGRLCVVGVDPGVMSTGMQRLAPWVIRVLIFKIIYPLVQFVSPSSGPRPTSRAAGEVLEAAFGKQGGDELPKDRYMFEGSERETGEESRDVAKRTVVWKETVALTGLKEGDTVLANWQ